MNFKQYILTEGLTLNKLRQLFDKATKGIEDEDLLDDVYSEWLLYLEQSLKDRMRVYKGKESGWEGWRGISNLKEAIAQLDRNYTKPFKQKLMALNQAIQVYHNDTYWLQHYAGWKYENEAVDFLDWLQHRTTYDTTTLPKGVVTALIYKWDKKRRIWFDIKGRVNFGSTSTSNVKDAQKQLQDEWNITPELAKQLIDKASKKPRYEL